MTDETDSVSEVARVLATHQVDHIGDNYLVCRRCGGIAAGTTVTGHQAAVLAEAGLLAEEDTATELLTREREDTLRDLHARYHDEVGNLLGRDECGWDGCEYWDAAKVAMEELDRAGLLRPQIATQEPAERTQGGSAGRGTSDSADGPTARVLDLAQQFEREGRVGIARMVREAVGDVATYTPAQHYADGVIHLDEPVSWEIGRSEP